MPQWTPEQARAYSAIGSAAATAARKRRAESRAESLRTVPSAERVAPEEDYSGLLLIRTRAHVSNLNYVLSHELTRPSPDPTKIDRLASAWERLAEVERRLAGRPLPGSRRPPREEPIRQLTTRPRGLPPPPARPAQEPPPSPAPSTIDDEPDEPDGLQSEPID